MAWQLRRSIAGNAGLFLAPTRAAAAAHAEARPVKGIDPLAGAGQMGRVIQEQ